MDVRSHQLRKSGTAPGPGGLESQVRVHSQAIHGTEFVIQCTLGFSCM